MATFQEEPFYEVTYEAGELTVLDIMQAVALATDICSIADPDDPDDIIETYKPPFVINSQPFETALETLYRLVNMTNMFLRVTPTLPD